LGTDAAAASANAWLAGKGGARPIVKAVVLLDAMAAVFAAAAFIVPGCICNRRGGKHQCQY
jgi:hypothetical protein